MVKHGFNPSTWKVNTISSPTLNVNGTPAKAMKCKDRTTGLAWKAGELMTLVYDGTNWCIVEGYSLADRPVNAHHIQYNGEETPAARFGGTWQIDTDYTGRVLVGSGTGFTIGATGGEATHTLTIEEMPSHVHQLAFFEGEAGGLGAAALGALYGVAIQEKIADERVIVFFAVICGVGALISMVGDLAASAIKRNAQIKDYGKLIPGHGGVMDRFDSVIFTAPVIYFMAVFLLTETSL